MHSQDDTNYTYKLRTRKKHTVLMLLLPVRSEPHPLVQHVSDGRAAQCAPQGRDGHPADVQQVRLLRSGGRGGGSGGGGGEGCVGVRVCESNGRV